MMLKWIRCHGALPVIKTLMFQGCLFSALWEICVAMDGEISEHAGTGRSDGVGQSIALLKVPHSKCERRKKQKRKSGQGFF